MKASQPKIKYQTGQSIQSEIAYLSNAILAMRQLEARFGYSFPETLLQLEGNRDTLKDIQDAMNDPSLIQVC
jgi:hypothetical protein